MKYKIDPIPRMPEWFVPGIVCRVRDSEEQDWQKAPRTLWGFMEEHCRFHFVDSFGFRWHYAEPVEQWEPQEGEWVAAWRENTQQHVHIVKYSKQSELSNSISGTIHETSAGLMANVARLQYPDGRVIDCACDVETLKTRTDWI